MRWSSTRPSRSSAVRLAIAGLVCWLVAHAASRAAAAPLDAQFAVIASAGVPVDDLTFEELRRVFLFKRSVWRPGQPVYVILPDSGLPARTFLLKHIYRMSGEDFRRFILDRIFQAEIDFAPKVVGSDSEAVAFVKAGRSIVAMVSATASHPPDVKVLRIDGKLPREAGYRLVDR